MSLPKRPRGGKHPAPDPTAETVTPRKSAKTPSVTRKRKRKRRSNAARQKAYRDRRRGGPPRGRWADHTPKATPAGQLGFGRVLLVMVEWLRTIAPDVAQDISHGDIPVSPADRRLRDLLAECLDRTRQELLGNAHPEAWYGVRLVVRRRRDRFEFVLEPA